VYLPACDAGRSFPDRENGQLLVAAHVNSVYHFIDCVDRKRGQPVFQ